MLVLRVLTMLVLLLEPQQQLDDDVGTFFLVDLCSGKDKADTPRMEEDRKLRRPPRLERKMANMNPHCTTTRCTTAHICAQGCFGTPALPHKEFSSVDL